MKKIFKLTSLLFAAWLAVPTFLATSPVPKQFITLSADRKYLINSFTNKPVFIIGEDGFLLTIQISNSEIDAYLQDRAAKGFNLIWVGLIDSFDQNNAPRNFAGNVPFDGPDFTNFDAAYWAHIDFVLERARTYGITLAMGVSFVGGQYQASINKASDEVLTAYGTFLGNRYKHFPNIIWVLGGDADPTTVSYAKLNQISDAIAAADPNHLFTFEAFRTAAPQSTIDGYRQARINLPRYMTINWVYLRQTSVVPGCRTAYGDKATLPPILGEDWYELDHSMTSFQVRQEGYWGILSGCYLGRIFGNGALWTFNSRNGFHTTPSWQNQLNSVGSVGHQYLGALMSSREHWLMVPDTNNSVLTAGFGSGPTLSVAARSSDGKTIVAYLSDGNATAKTFDMRKITSDSSMVNAWWYNPRTGEPTFIGKFPNTGHRNFSPPDGSDWVLVLDDASANLPKPGSSVSPRKEPFEVTELID